MERAARGGWRHAFHVLLYGLFTCLSAYLLTAETPAWPVAHEGTSAVPCVRGTACRPALQPSLSNPEIVMPFAFPTWLARSTAPARS